MFHPPTFSTKAFPSKKTKQPYTSIITLTSKAKFSQAATSQGPTSNKKKNKRKNKNHHI